MALQITTVDDVLDFVDDGLVFEVGEADNLYVLGEADEHGNRDSVAVFARGTWISAVMADEFVTNPPS